MGKLSGKTAIITGASAGFIKVREKTGRSVKYRKLLSFLESAELAKYAEEIDADLKACFRSIFQYGGHSFAVWDKCFL